VPLDYNLLLGRNWTYAMTVIISSIFHTLCFPHDGKIVMINQFYFAYAIPNTYVGLSIPVVDNSQLRIENNCVRMYSSLMGTFDFMAPIHMFTPCLVSPFRQRGSFLSTLPILTILGPYLP
jgi:hypothetical protein